MDTDYHYPQDELAHFLSDYTLKTLLPDDPIYHNLGRLGDRLKLSEAEKRLLTFVCYLEGKE